MTKEEFLQKQNASKLENIKYAISALETFTFLNIEYVNYEKSTLTEVSEITNKFLIQDGNTELIDIRKEANIVTLITDIIRNSLRKMSTEATLKTQILKPYIALGNLLNGLLNEYVDFNKEQLILTNGLIASELIINHTTDQRIITGTQYNIGSIESTSIWVDPYQYYNDNRLFVLRPGAITLQLRQFDVTDNDDISAVYDIIINPEFVEVLTLNLIY